MGPEALSLRQVARRADFSPAALYNYFSSRDEIIASLFAESFERLNTYLKRVPTDLPLKTRVVELGMAYLDFGRENPMDLRCVLAATSRKAWSIPACMALGLSAVGSSATRSARGWKRGGSPATSLFPPRSWPTVCGRSSMDWCR